MEIKPRSIIAKGVKGLIIPGFEGKPTSLYKLVMDRKFKARELRKQLKQLTTEMKALIEKDNYYRLLKIRSQIMQNTSQLLADFGQREYDRRSNWVKHQCNIDLHSFDVEYEIAGCDRIYFNDVKVYPLMLPVYNLEDDTDDTDDTEE
jgi:hypothetical protein